MRKLVTVEKINKIIEHPNADRLEIAQVRGWQVIVKKDEFKEGDLCLFFEIDSFLPVDDNYEFLRKNSYKNHPTLGEGFKIKSNKLRGVLSQGLILPIAVLYDKVTDAVFDIGDDVTSFLNVQKWEPPIPIGLNGNAKGNFPYFIKKTDLDRIQNCFDVVSTIDCEWVIEEKLDGTSCTIYHNSEFSSFGYCSRNFELKIPENGDTNMYYSIVEKGDFQNVLKKYNKSIAIQGELCGPKIQNNIYKLNEPTLFVFDIWLIDKQRYATRLERFDIIKDLNILGCNITQVPHLGTCNTPKTLDEFLTMANGISKLHNTPREGIVFKSFDVINNEIVAFKAISNNFLLKHEG